MLLAESKKDQDEKLKSVMDAVSQLTATTEKLSSTTDRIMESMNHRILSTCSHGSARAGSSSRKTSEGRKRKHPEKVDDVPYLALIKSIDKTQFFVKWSTGFTINSFARSYPALWKWLPEETRNHHAPYSDLIANSSALSLLFFSCVDSNWERNMSGTGKLFTFLCASVISSAILEVRRTEFGVARGRVVPEWMAAFGGRASTAKYVWNYCMVLDSTKKILSRLRSDDTYVRAKRARSEGPPDKFRADKDFAISSVRHILRNSLSYGRTEARKHILEGFMFLVDKIKTFPSIGQARDAGFMLKFVEEESEVESIVPENIADTIWDIGDCETVTGTEAELQKANNALLRKVAGDFPSLFLKLTWQRRIVAEDGVSEIPEDIPKYWQETQDVSLHEIALKILTSMSLAAKDTKLVMRSSKLTVKAVHILAIGLRGVVRQCLAQEPTAIEKSAMGSMTAHGLDEDLDIVVVSATLGKRTSKEVQKTTAVDSIRNEKFTIKLKEYWKKLKAQQDAQRRLNEGSSRSVGCVSSLLGNIEEMQGMRDVELDEEDKSDIEEPFLV